MTETDMIIEKINQLSDKLPETYRMFVDLVKESSQVNATVAGRIAAFQEQIIKNQTELKNAILQIVEAIDNGNEPCTFSSMCQDLEKLLNGPKHEFMKQVEDAKEINLVKKIKTFIMVCATIITIASIISVFLSFYNPFSKKEDKQMERVIELLKKERGNDILP